MNLVRISLIIAACFVSFNAVSANNSTELSAWQKKKIADEFNSYFKSTDSGAFQKLNKDPWASKRAKQSQRTNRILQGSASLDSCRQYSLKQRRQCFVKGSNDSTCELFYKARLDHCAKYF